MRIILIGNYPKDNQESMERFAKMLDDGFRKKGLDTEIWRPVALFASNFRHTNSGLGKWLGYFDKWILFPFILKWRIANEKARSATRFHVCDHSNSPYLKYLPKTNTAITCHDVLAIRGAFGFSDAYCDASGLGIFLQKWILTNLAKARLLASVSNLTLNQLKELAQNKQPKESVWQVIHNAFNAHFFPMKREDSNVLLKQAGLEPGIPFLLHVGSGLPRKNRILLVNMLSKLSNSWTGIICFAGEKPNDELLNHINKSGLSSRILFINNPDHQTLVALYSTCEAFIFPSFSEGFGWPVIEAQACGAPVIASNIEPMPEVSGGAALHADPYNSDEFVNAFLSLTDAKRTEIIRKGFENSARFQVEVMIDAYLKLHGLK